MKNLDSIKFPAGMHQRIMRAVYAKKLIKPLFYVGLVVALNAAVMAWQIWMRLIEADIFVVAPIILSSFELDIDYVRSVMSILNDSVPAGLSVMFALNLGVAGFLVYFVRKIKHNVSTFKTN